MGFKVDLSGKVFGELICLSFSHNDNGGRSVWNCSCRCGKLVKICGQSLTKGLSRSCGCLREKHLLSKTKFYWVYYRMMQRCHNEASDVYHYYGGRGIVVCERWHNFLNFKEDMFDGWKDKLTLERVDVNGHYCKENCLWVTRSQQSRNRTKCINNTSGVTGVYKSSDQKGWLAKWCDPETNKQGSKYFSISKYGDNAFEMACAYRSEMILLLNLKGANYTESHGLERQTINNKELIEKEKESV